MSESDLRCILAERLKHRGAKAALAAELGVSDAFVSNVVLGRKRITDKIAAYLGYRRVVEYKPMRAMHPLDLTGERG